MKDICAKVFRDATGVAFEWLTGPDRGMAIICGLEPGHDGKHKTDDGIYSWED